MDEVSKFVAFLERYDGNGEYVQGGVSKFIDTTATKTITTLGMVSYKLL